MLAFASQPTSLRFNYVYLHPGHVVHRKEKLDIKQLVTIFEKRIVYSKGTSDLKSSIGTCLSSICSRACMLMNVIISDILFDYRRLM